jgi:hypothetical protein
LPNRFADRRWLKELLDEELRSHDPDLARARLPLEVRTAGASPTDLAPGARLLVARSLRRRRLTAEPLPPEEVFLDDVRAHVGLAVDLALLRRDPFVRARRRAELVAFLAAAVGEHALAIAVEAEQPGGASDLDVRAARVAAADALVARFFPPRDPPHGLPLYPGALAVLRRRLARVVVGFHREGRLAPEALERHAAYAAKESVLLAEALSGLLRAAGRAGPAAERVWSRQLTRLGLGRAETREARRAVAAPRDPEALAAATPAPVRPFLFEQLRLAHLRLKLADDARTSAHVELFVRAAGLDAPTVLAAEVEAAAQHADHADWLDALDVGGAERVEFLDQWDEMADQVVERVSAAVTDNLGALATEIRETGELGQLLTQAAAGKRLTSDEKRKVKAQLIDLAKAVPALAIFAAPGGLLLLPLLAKLLPFSLVPSAWEKLPAPPRKRAGGA